MSVTIELIVSFHDYMIVIMTAIFIVVTYIFITVSITSGLDKVITESHFLEFV